MFPSDSLTWLFGSFYVIWWCICLFPVHGSKWVPETGKIDVSRHFGMHVCEERGRSGLALLRWCHVLHLPFIRSCIPALLWLPITGTAEAMVHTQALVPQLSPRVDKGPQVPARGRAQEGQGVFKAEHVANMSWPYLLLQFLTAEHYWNPGAGSCVYPFLYLFCLSLFLLLLIPSSWNFWGT